ncbi:MAG: APC family permease, partial [Actinomycetota bacterium]
VEAIADGVQAFRYPKSRNAATTLAIMAVLSISMFLGISWLARHTGVVFTEETERIVVAQIADAVFGEGPLFYLVAVMTAGILILAANTAYQDFPRLSSILAGDHFMPRQFLNRGDRLVFSNGVLILATLASLLIIVFDANLNSLIQLYLVGVFISFTLSQTGMVLRWRRVGGPGWKARAAVNGFGAIVTGVVFFVIVTTKWSGGAWIVIAAIPVLIYMMHSIHRHYEDVANQLALPERRPRDARPGHQHLVILVPRVDAAAARAVGYARSIRPEDIVAVAPDPELVGPWRTLAGEIPLQILPSDGSTSKRLKTFLQQRRSDLAPTDFLSVVVPEVLQRRGLREIVSRPAMHRLKASLLIEEGVQVVDVPVVKETIDPQQDQSHEPARNYVCVLVSGVHNVTLHAIEFAETLRPTDLRAVTVGLDPEATERIGDEWLRAGIPHPLEIEDSPFRDIGRSLVGYVRQFRPDGLNRVVTVVIPEFVVGKRRHQLLHGQTALIVKRHLLFETGVVVASVPYHLEG